MARQIPLEQTASVTLNGAGNGTVTIVPSIVERWTINTVMVTTSTATKIPVFRLYMGQGPNASEQVDATYNGAQNVSDALANREVPSGYKIIGVWSAGDANAIATMTVRGTKMVQ